MFRETLAVNLSVNGVQGPDFTEFRIPTIFEHASAGVCEQTSAA